MSQLGTIRPKGTLYICTHVGDATDGENQYEMTLVNGHIPAVRSVTSGKFYLLSWEDILAMSVKAGIDKVDE